MPFTGHNLYRGIGGLSSVDFSTVVNTAVAGASTITAGSATHAPNTTYTYVLRPVIADLETPDQSCHVTFTTDDDTDWSGLAPAPVIGLSAQLLDDAEIRLTWHYHVPSGFATPATFGVYYATAPGIAVGTPDASVTYAGQTRHQ